MNRLIIIALLFTSIVSNAQINQELRRELPLSDNISDYDIALFGESGVLIYGNDLVNLSTRRWKFTKLDKEFNSIDSVSMDLPRQLILHSSYTIGRQLVMFFVSPKRRSWHMSIIDFNTLKIKGFNGASPKKAGFRAIKVCGDKAFTVMSLKKANFFFTIDMLTGASQKTLIKPPLGRKIWIEGLEVDTVNLQAIVYLGYYLKSKSSGMQVLIYNSRGELSESINLSGEKDYNLTSLSSTRIGPGHYLFTGTYSKQSSFQGEGLFISEVKRGKRTFLKYYNFLDLKNFTTYLPKRTQDKIERKKKRRKALGVELSYNYFMASHEIIVIGNNYYYLGESYYPTYRTETYTTYVNGSPVTQYRTVFDGYQYTHAVLACFDGDGKLLWDNCFEMFPIYKPFRVVRFVTRTVSNDGRIDLLFANRASIIIKSFDTDGKIVRERDYAGIVTGGDDDKVKYSFSLMKHWYGDHFLAYGYQRIKDKSKKSGEKIRRVFFLNKVSPE